MLELENCQNVVVGIHWDFQQSRQLLGHGAAGCYAKEVRGRWEERKKNLKNARRIVNLIQAWAIV